MQAQQMANMVTHQAGAGLGCHIWEYRWHQLVTFHHLHVLRCFGADPLTAKSPQFW